MEARAARYEASLQWDGQGPPGSPHPGEVHPPEYQSISLDWEGSTHDQEEDA